MVYISMASFLLPPLHHYYTVIYSGICCAPLQELASKKQKQR